MESKDVSKNLIISLMFLAVVVTFIGTLLIFSSLEELKGVKSYEEPTSTGKIGIDILSTPEPMVAGGKIGINILDTSQNNNQ